MFPYIILALPKRELSEGLDLSYSPYTRGSSLETTGQFSIIN